MWYILRTTDFLYWGYAISVLAEAHCTNRYSRYDRYYANTVSTMASSGFGPYHGQWHVDAPTKCIGAIPTLWVMTIALGLV